MSGRGFPFCPPPAPFVSGLTAARCRFHIDIGAPEDLVGLGQKRERHQERTLQIANKHQHERRNHGHRLHARSVRTASSGFNSCAETRLCICSCEVNSLVKEAISCRLSSAALMRRGIWASFPIQGMKRPLVERQPVVALAMYHSPRQHGQIEEGYQVYLDLMPALRLQYVITQLSAYIGPYCGRAVFTWVSTSKRR